MRRSSPEGQRRFPAGALWDGDPGVAVDLDAIPTALPNGDPRPIRGALSRAFAIERGRWTRLGVGSQVRTLTANARGKRANSLRTALTEDDPTGIALGWPDPDEAARVLGRQFRRVERRGRRTSDLPVAVLIGIGGSALEGAPIGARPRVEPGREGRRRGGGSERNTRGGGQAVAGRHASGPE